jgi:hypothetical protein
MWEHLLMVKESKGRLGILATPRALYRMTTSEGSDFKSSANREKSGNP